MKIAHIPQYIKMYWNNCYRKFIIMPSYIRKLQNTNFSIISSNCNGGVACHDLKVRFNSPTVNLSMSAGDFLKFVKHLEYYVNTDIVERKDDTVTYPVGLLGNEILLHFMHYNSFEEAVKKWNERKKRINYQNLFLMMTDRDGCTEAMIKEFDRLPYKNKILFSASDYPELKSVVYCSEFSDKECVPILTEWRNMRGERLYDRYFDVVEWLNGGKND